MGALDEVTAAAAKVSAVAAGSVVGIGRRWHRGSGLLVAADRVLTNAHNVHGDDAGVVYGDGSATRGRLLGRDVDGDLAVLEVEAAPGSPVSWADGGAGPAVGTPVLAAAAANWGGLRVTVGFVSGVDRSFRGPGGLLIGGSIEHTAPLAPGSSGSALFDVTGRLLGLNTQRVGDGFYLAIPADAAFRDRVAALSRGESPARPRLGIEVAPAQVARHLRHAVGLPDVDGVLVRGVEPGSPADGAGIREGDLIVSVGGVAVADADALHTALAGAGRTEMEIGLVRGATEIKVTATLA